MKTFELSTYQENILKNVKKTNNNLLIDAKAGSGKTSTLLLIADEILKKNKKCLFLAFNKSIVEELRTKIISNDCDIKTLHSTGLSFLRSYLYKKYGKDGYELEIDNDKSKIRNLVRAYFEELCYTDVVENNPDKDDTSLKEFIYTLQTELIKLVDFCRFYNINYHEEPQVRYLMYQTCTELKDYQNIGMKDYQKVIEKTLDQIKYIFENPNTTPNGKAYFLIDYTDMIYFPCLYGMQVPYSIREYLDYILVDESQDLSILQQIFLKRLNNGLSRYIFVGDKFQAIYGFAGADTKSIDNIKKNFSVKELPLNICYRCPENVIRLSQTIVPTIEWNKLRADKGEVKLIEGNDFVEDLSPNDIIIGRKNKDLVLLYKKLVLDKKVSVKFKNRDLVNHIVNELTDVVKGYITLYNKHYNVDRELYMSFIGPDRIDSIDKDYIYNLFDKKEIESKGRELIKKAKAESSKPISKSKYSIDYLKLCMQEYKQEGAYHFEKESIGTEYFSIIESFLEEYKSVESSILVTDFLTYIKTFLSGNMYKEVPIISSIHSMKGSEADNIYIIDYPRFPYKFRNQSDEELQQERNLQYVALTRAKKNLYLCLLDSNEEKDIKLNEEARSNVNYALKRRIYD